MKKLSLIIKQEYFDQILAGTKKIETREIRPNNAGRYCEFNSDGELTGPKQYDALQLFVGYQPNRPSADVAVTRAEIRILQDEDGNNLTYMHNGEEYVEAIAVYDLGQILNKQNC